MKAIRLAMALGLASGLASAAFLACGGSESSVDGTDASADSSSGGGGDNGGGGGDNGGGGGGDNGGGGGGGGDAGTDGSTQGPGPSTPGKVTCGSQSCNSATQSCCIRLDGGAACSTRGDNCPINTVQLRCDEKADCTQGRNTVCCGSVEVAAVGRNVGFAGIQSSCDNACNPRTQKQLCKTNAECGDAGPCVTQTCHGETFSTCGGFPNLDAGGYCSR